MKLHHNPASPYVRKVRIVALEKRLHDQIELVPEKLSPIAPSGGVNRSNPLGKIPTLVLDDGTALFDSRVICEYLDSLGEGPRLFPAGGDARWTALRRQALADGVLDAAVGTRYELTLRPSENQWPEWIENQKEKFRRALDALEPHADELGDTLDIGIVSIGCALGYLDFRFGDERWQSTRPNLAAWYTAWSARPSAKQTVPA